MLVLGLVKISIFLVKLQNFYNFVNVVDSF